MFLDSTLAHIFFLFLFLHQNHATGSNRSEEEFTYNGFRGANLDLDGLASITPNGLLMLTNETKKMKGHAFHPSPFHFRNRSTGGALSFSATFVFAILPQYVNLSSHGMALVISPTKNFSEAFPNQFLGLFNRRNNGNSTNHVFAIELDTVTSVEFQDIDDNHVGIDINSLISNRSYTAGYYADDSGSFKNLSLVSGEAMQIWIDYDGEKRRVDVTLASVLMAKPHKPLLSATIDLSSVLMDDMYVGFSSSTGTILASHCLLGWSFKMNGIAQALNYSSLPKLPRRKSKAGPKVLEIMLPIASAVLVLAVVGSVLFVVRHRVKYAELHEDWELEYGAHRFSYKDLFNATKGFNKNQLLGIGGFGRVYKGILPSSSLEVAVKKVSHESRQGMREFIAEVVSMSQLRHRNLVQLLGYCRRKTELLLVYDYIRNGSLDKFLYDHTKPPLNWATRLRIIKGVSSGLLYLHEEWKQVVVHRDIKASNVLLDDEFNGRLGDFGLARLYDHGTDPQTTHVVGTIGYLAPELARTGKATAATDVFAFGVFIFEVVCGRRPVETVPSGEQLVLLDWVVDNWRRGTILGTTDPRLGEEYVVEEMELVLKLGLLCSHPLPVTRPSMRQVVQYLEGNAPLPELTPTNLSFSTFALHHSEEGFDDYIMSYPSLSSTAAPASVCDHVNYHYQRLQAR